jgi:hypothetical protein
MTTETMTIHRGLAELKVLDSRIEKEIGQTTFAYPNRHSNSKINGETIDIVKGNIKSNYDKINSLMARKSAIKRAIDLSNSKTMVKVGDKEMTVVEAINMKNHGISDYQLLLIKLESAYKTAIVKIFNENNTLEDKAETYVVSMYGGKDTKTDASIIKKAKEDFIESNQYDLVDGIGILNEINKLKDKIDNFCAEVDAVLSESNAITQISIEY